MTLIGTASALWLGNTTQVKNNGTDPSLVGWWKCDGNSSDSSSYHFSGIWSGTEAYSVDHNNQPNHACNFNGSSYISMGDVDRMGTSNWTVSAWFKSSGPSGSNQTIVDKGQIAAGYPRYDVFISGATHCLNARFGDGTGAVISLSPTCPAVDNNVWHFMSVIFTRNSNMVMYLDGTIIGSTSIASMQGYNGDTWGLLIGNEDNVSTSTFNGSLDDVRIYNRALSVSDVRTLYKPPAATIDSSQQGLIAWWKLNGNAKDSTPYARNGVTYTSAADGLPTPTTDREGKANGAMYFDGHQCIQVSSPISPVAQSFTMSAWIDPSTSSGDIVGANGPYLFWLTSGNELEAGVQDGSGWKWTTSPANSITLNKWQYVTMTYTGSHKKLYVNGNLVTEDTTTVGGLQTFLKPIGIGCDVYNGQQYFKGSISDVRIYNRALTPQEIKTQYQSYNSQITLQSPKPTNTINLNYGLVGYWPFNNNTRDMTVYQDNGVLHGATPPVLTTDRNGKANGAMGFTGASGQCVQVPWQKQLTNAPNNQWTLSAWIDPTSTNGSFDIVRNSDGDQGYYLGVYYGTLKAFFSPDQVNTDSMSLASPTGLIKTNQWQLATAEYDGTSIRLYLNGVLVANQAFNKTLNFIHELVAIGSTPWSGCGAEIFSGSIDDVRIYNRALSPAEIQALYSTYY